jgi:hypothetical protein
MLSKLHNALRHAVSVTAAVNDSGEEVWATALTNPRFFAREGGA